MSNCNLIMFRASGRSAPADRQAEDPRSVSVQDKKYVRYEEGAVLYSMGKNSFRQVAQDAHAIVRLKRIALVNVEVLDEYLESFRE